MWSERQCLKIFSLPSFLAAPCSSNAVAGATTPTGPGTSTSTAPHQTPAMRGVQFPSHAALLYQER